MRLILFLTILISYSVTAQRKKAYTAHEVIKELSEYATVEEKQDSLELIAKAIVRMPIGESTKVFQRLDSIVTEDRLRVAYYQEWASIVSRSGNVKQSKYLRSQGLAIAKKNNYEYYQFKFNKGLASHYINLAKADSASFYIIAADKLAKEFPGVLDNHRWQIPFVQASIYDILGNEVAQQKSLEDCWEIIQENPNGQQRGLLLFILLDFYKKQGNLLKQAEFTELFLAYYNDKKKTTPDFHFPIESILLKDDSEESLRELTTILKLSDSLNNLNTLAQTTLTLSTNLIKSKRPNEAIPYLENAIYKLEKAKYPYTNSNLLILLKQAHEGSGDYKSALAIVEKQKSMEDSLRSSQTLDNIANYEVKYKTAETQLALEKKNAAQKFLYAIIVSGIVLIGVIGYFLYKNRKKNQLLSSQKEKLQIALSEKEILLKEIHHRVKNNLQVISSLLSLQQRQINDPKASKAFQIGRNRVRAMSLIHQNLYQEGNLIGVSVTDYINKLANSLVTNYKMEDKKIQLNLNIVPINLDVDTIIPIGLIINELISNTLKYAFTNKDDGTITIDLSRDNDELYLSVKDNGGGFPDSFNKEETTTLGYRLIKAFSEKLKAKLSIDSSTGGTEVALQIPYLK